MLRLFPALFLFQIFCPAVFAAHGGTIKGLVVEAESNTELPGAVLRLNYNGRSCVANELGMFVFSDLPGGEYLLSVSYVGYEPDSQRIAVSDHETVTVKFSLKIARVEMSEVEINAHARQPLANISALDIRLRPINSAQDVLRFVPGIVTAQHAGGGKAEQIFLRGFDIDHGTDIALFADGVPVNMPSHAHGQGYADLHFIIPELIQNVDFQKGTYDARVGDFATAGFVKFETADALAENFLKLEGGQFGNLRAVAGLDLLGKKRAAAGSSAYIAAEAMFSDSYFEHNQNFKRLNLMGKYRMAIDERQMLSIGFQQFHSTWSASGQIPERAVQRGQIAWFGAIDPTEGGATSRRSLNLQHLYALSDKSLIKNQLWLAHYDFELYSNFTFFLNDPLNGDQIRQKESRRLAGWNTALQHQAQLLGREFESETGLDFRLDETADSELSHSKNRTATLARISFGNVEEWNAAAYSTATWKLTSRWSLEGGLRFNHFRFLYENKLDTLAGPKSAAKNRPDPKLSVRFQASPTLQFFAQTGTGFHSNDARVILENRIGQSLPTAWSTDLGFVLKPIARLLLVASVFQLDLDQEFVYVGDEGVVEPSGRTRRIGLDASLRWQILPQLFFDGDLCLAKPRALDVPENEAFIPLAPRLTSSGGATLEQKNLRASLRYRYVGDRPANEDNSLTAEGYFLLDGAVSFSPVFKQGKQPLEFKLTAQNLSDRRWKEAQFATETRLREEAAPVTEIHFTPGTPFFLKGSVAFNF